MQKFMLAFIFVCIVHLSEHIAQMLQVYSWGWEAHEAKGFIGYFYPWLAHSEVLHYGYALFMVVGLWLLRNEFSGAARWWWMVAFYIQFWHHIEHAILIGQVIAGANLLDAPQPISVIQLVGLLRGSAESGFGGLLTMSHFGVCNCAGAKPGTIHEFELMLVFVRRIEVHMLYNTLVSVPMVIAMWKGFRYATGR